LILDWDERGNMNQAIGIGEGERGSKSIRIDAKRNGDDL
jgi:hypothetical protein